MTAASVLGTVVSGGVPTNASVSHTLSAGNNRWVLGAGFSSSPTPTGRAWYGGVEMILLGHVERSTWIYITVYGLPECMLPADGANTFQAGGCTNVMCFAIQDASQTIPIISEGVATGCANLVSDVITTVYDDSLICSWAFVYDSSIGFTHGTDQTEIKEATYGNNRYSCTTEVISTAGSDTQSHTAQVSKYYLMWSCVFAPADALTATANPILGKVITGDWNGDSTPDLTHALVAGYNRKVVLGVLHDGQASDDTITATYDGVSMTRIWSNRQAATDNDAAFFYIDLDDAKAAGDYTITITVTGTAGDVTAVAACLQYMATGAEEDEDTVGWASAVTQQAASVTPVTSESMIVGFGSVYTNNFYNKNPYADQDKLMPVAFEPSTDCDNMAFAIEQREDTDARSLNPFESLTAHTNHTYVAVFGMDRTVGGASVGHLVGMSNM